MFGFPKVDRNEANSFNRNYLKSVIFQVRYEPNEIIILNKATIIEKFKDLYPRIQDNLQNGFAISITANQTPILQPMTEKDSGFELRSQDGQKVLSFSKDTISYTISGKSYGKYENLVEDIKLILEVLALCNIKSVNRIAIRKVNILEFQIPATDNVSPMQIMGLVLNDNLISNINYFPNLNYVQQNIHTVNYVNSTDHLNLRYGLVLPLPDKKSGQILIDIDCFKVDSISVDYIIQNTKLINDEIFNVFNWSFKPDTIAQLKVK